jgi:hypothetical protein
VRLSTSKVTEIACLAIRYDINRISCTHRLSSILFSFATGSVAGRTNASSLAWPVAPKSTAHQSAANRLMMTRRSCSCCGNNLMTTVQRMRAELEARQRR